jgi:UPF0755 protein
VTGWRAAIVALALLAAAGGLLLRWALAPIDANDPQPIAFEVAAGTSARGVARDLAEAGVIRHPWVILAVLTWRGDQGRVGEGLYELRRDQDAFALSDALVRGGQPRTARLLLPEGIRARDVARRITQAGWSDPPADALLDDPPAALRPAGVPEGATLEGYLFPATYELPIRFGTEAVIAAMVRRFEREVTPERSAAMEALGLDLHGWVTLASLVQAEAGGIDEMPIIAGVFLNRLEIGMPLQSDPTVAYGLGKDLPELNRRAGDFERDHAWNTYTRRGLPHSPIGNPGGEALEAVLTAVRRNDAGQVWLYFMHGVDAEGAAVFRPNVSFEAHLRDVNRYLRR